MIDQRRELTPLSGDLPIGAPAIDRGGEQMGDRLQKVDIHRGVVLPLPSIGGQHAVGAALIAGDGHAERAARACLTCRLPDREARFLIEVGSDGRLRMGYRPPASSLTQRHSCAARQLEWTVHRRNHGLIAGYVELRDGRAGRAHDGCDALTDRGEVVGKAAQDFPP